ncbi:hypothetical protein FQR65_LT20017 [Abscondita terminalis]|nr:hypothetical protein FQR65_LT20017 [Abscondita terminalis]
MHIDNAHWLSGIYGYQLHDDITLANFSSLPSVMRCGEPFGANDHEHELTYHDTTNDVIQDRLFQSVKIEAMVKLTPVSEIDRTSNTSLHGPWMCCPDSDNQYTHFALQPTSEDQRNDEIVLGHGWPLQLDFW